MKEGFLCVQECHGVLPRIQKAQILVISGWQLEQAFYIHQNLFHLQPLNNNSTIITHIMWFLKKLIGQAHRCSGSRAGFVGGTAWHALADVVSPSYDTAVVACSPHGCYSYQWEEPKNNWLPSGKVWKACYKYSLTAHTEQWGDNKCRTKAHEVGIVHQVRWMRKGFVHS